jgi:ABC-type histidine transport system ATPase subunit
VADQLVFLLDGSVHEAGAARALFTEPATAELHRFIGAMAPAQQL